MTDRSTFVLVRVLAVAVAIVCLPTAIYAWTEMPDSLPRSLLVATGIPLAVAGFIVSRGTRPVRTDEPPMMLICPRQDALRRVLSRRLRVIAMLWLALLVPFYWKIAEVRTSPPTLVWLWVALMTSIPILLAESVRTSRSDDH